MNGDNKASTGTRILENLGDMPVEKWDEAMRKAELSEMRRARWLAAQSKPAKDDDATT